MKVNEEKWVPIYGYEHNYLVSNIGRVFTLKNNRIKRTSITAGYEYVQLSKNGSNKSLRLHRLICYSFIGYSNLEIN